MNKIFNRKGVLAKSLSVWSAFATLVTTAAPAFAGSTDVLGGNAVLTGMARATLDANDANAAVFSSSSASAVLDWSKFNIGSGQSMSFNGPTTTFFNLVDGPKSQIDGIINGDHNVWVINPAGIAFGAGSSVNVGGLFAAAAGNLENAAALRDGTATTPAFSSFAGTVDASKGSFTANQVALMGKTVTTAGGDFTDAKGLSVTASTGAMTVDEVEGGKVSVNISDFVADDAEVVLGELHVDGNLSVKATGSILAGINPAEAPANRPMLMAEKKGPVDQPGDIDIEGVDIEIEGKLRSTAGHVDVLAYGGLDVNADVEAADYVSLQAVGDVDVNADVTAGRDTTIYSYNGSITVEADKTVSALGNVDITAGMGEGVKGDVTINGNVESSFGDVMLYSGYGNQSTGDVTINGNVTAEYGGIQVWSRDGDVMINGKISAMDAENGFAYVNAAQGDNSVGDIVVNGTVESGVETLLGAGHDYNGGLTGGKGSVTVNEEGLVLGEYGSTYVWAAGGAGKGVEIGGEVRGYRVVLGSRDESGIVAKPGARITAGFEDDEGRVILPGKLFVDARSGDANLSNAKITTGTASVNAYGEIRIDGGDNDFMETVDATGASVSIVDANDLVLADVKATAGAVVVATHDGNITVAEGKTVESSMPYYGFDIGSVTLTAGMDEGANGGITIDGVVRAAGDYGSVIISSAAGEASVGDINVNGMVVAGGIAQVGAGYDELALQTGGKGGVNVSENGLILSAGDAYVLATGKNGVEVSGAIAGDGQVTVATTGEAGVRGSGILEGVEALNVYANNGSVNFSGTMFAGVADLSARDGITANNANNDFGIVTATSEGSVSIVDANDIALSEVSARNGSLSLTAIDGSIFQMNDDSKIETGDAHFSAADDVLLMNEGNDFTGKVTADATSIALYDRNNLLLGDVSAVGGVEFDPQGQMIQNGIDAYANGRLTVVDGSTLSVVGDGACVRLVSDTDSVKIDGKVLASGDLSTIEAMAAADIEIKGQVNGDVVAVAANNVSVNGQIGGKVVEINGVSGDVDIAGSVEATDAGSGALVAEASGSVNITGTVTANGMAYVRGGSGVSVSGSVRSQSDASLLTRNGDIVVGGNVMARGGRSTLGDWGAGVSLIAGYEGAGSIFILGGGRVNGGEYVDLVAEHGSVMQGGYQGVAFSADGYAGVESLRSSVVADQVNFLVGGNVGGAYGGYFVVNGKVFGKIGGSANIAAGELSAWQGGSRPRNSAQWDVMTESQDSILEVGGDLNIYTASVLNPFGMLSAKGNLTLAAASFGNGDAHYFQAGGLLSLYNVGKQAHSQIAYFESRNGVEPKINNLPNDMVIFIDGRLAGGNLQILNKFGATEAFPVSTPELKSEQGIFGNPVFLHGDLDVANPMAVGNVDYMLQEIPRLTLASDFPLEVDKSVNTAGLNPKDVYRFGQHPQVAEEKPQTDQEEKNDDKASAEESAGQKVAMR